MIKEEFRKLKVRDRLVACNNSNSLVGEGAIIEVTKTSKSKNGRVKIEFKPIRGVSESLLGREIRETGTDGAKLGGWTYHSWAVYYKHSLHKEDNVLKKVL